MSIKKSQAILKREEREKRKEEAKKSSKCHKTWCRFLKFIANIGLPVTKCFENLDRFPAIWRQRIS